MRRAAIFLVSLVVSFSAAAQCTTQLAFSAIPKGTPITDRTWGVTFVNCPAVTATTFIAGSSGTLDLGGVSYEAVILTFVAANANNPNPQVVFTLKLPTGTTDPVNAFYATNTAVFKYPLTGQIQSYPLTMTQTLNIRAHSLHIGRADADQQNNGQNLPAIPPAYQLQISSTYSYRPPFVAPSSGAPFFSRIQRDFSLKIDTSDKKTGYVDDNSVSFGAFMPRLNVPGVVAQGKVGIALSYERPLHNNDHDGDATATAAGLIPLIKAVNIFSSQPKVASPLGLALSYGFRSKRMTGSTYQGRVFTGTAFYHVYLMDNYRIDLTATTTYNDLNNLPAGTSKTQHAFTAAVYYQTKPGSPYAAMAQFQNGSFGAVLTKLKQYFIGISVTKIDSFFNGDGQ